MTLDQLAALLSLIQSVIRAKQEELNLVDETINEDYEGVELVSDLEDVNILDDLANLLDIEPNQD